MYNLWTGTSTAHGGFSSVLWWIVPAISNYRCKEQHFVPYSTKCKPKTIRLEKDLRIASIALSVGGTVITCNQRDFSQIPGVKIKDWTI